MNTPNHSRGFTLLELLLSLALTALLLGLLSAGTYSVVNEWQRDTSSLDRKLDETLVLLQLERALLAAFPHSYLDMERLARVVYFQGDEHELRFVSAVSPRRSAGLTAWRLVSDTQEGLVLALTPALSDDPNARFETLDLQTLLPGYAAQFRYLWQRSPEEKVWLDTWDGAERRALPRAVQVMLTPQDATGDAERLDLVVPIKSYQHPQIEPVQGAF
ncbi:MAG: type II secretion system protein GspJ [Pseudomonadales bacterium]|jgi:general secretion pathway protein J|nr:type II secretion system protein GspJ [Pseudomonadales bacterium]